MRRDENFDRRDSRRPRRATDGRVDVALLLPLTGAQTTAPRSFLEFYQGVRLAVEEVGRQGVEVKLNLYDTRRSRERIADIIDDEAFRQSELILGPIYEEELQPVLEFADRYDVAVVSPLAQLRYSSSPMLFQLPPDPITRYDKLRALLASGTEKQIVVVHCGEDDTEFAGEILPTLSAGYAEMTYTRETPSAELTALLRGEREVVFVVLSHSEASINDFLARVGSLERGLTTRGATLAPIRVVGSSRWQRMPNIDRNLFFRLNLTFVTSYHADASDERVAQIDRRYIAAFGALPTPYAYRGYDAAKLFLAAVASPERMSFEQLLGRDVTPLQTPYRFEDQLNMEWALVRYGSDYTIAVE